jgi:hypothetical protein
VSGSGVEEEAKKKKEEVIFRTAFFFLFTTGEVLLSLSDRKSVIKKPQLNGG